MIPYFDAHCDTVSCCLGLNVPLRENTLQLDLRRGRGFSLFFCEIVRRGDRSARAYGKRYNA